MARLSTSSLVELADDAEITLDRSAFLDAVRAALVEHKIAARELDQTPLRGTSEILRDLVECLGNARELVAEVEHVTGVTYLESWGNDLPTRAELERKQDAVRNLLAKSCKPGAPTKAALDYTILQLLEIHERYEGIKPVSFVRGALKLIGFVTSARKVHDLTRWRERRNALADGK